MADLDLDELERLAKAATPGPYKVTDLRNMQDGHRDCIWIDVDRPDEIRTVAEIDDEGDLIPIWGIEDAEFIAATDPPTILALIERVKRAEAVIANARAAEKESTDWRDYGQTVDRILATYQNGADQ